MMNGNAGTQGRASPALSLQRERSYQRGHQDPSPTSGYTYGDGRPSMRGGEYPPSSRAVTPVPGRGAAPFSPPPPSQAPATAAPASGLEPPTQLKVKVHCPSASQTLTLVVPLNITYQSLKDRIEAKLQRSTNVSLVAGEGKVKLKYLDEEDFVSIQSDEDVLTAFETWREQWEGGGGAVEGGGMGEIELFCQR